MAFFNTIKPAILILSLAMIFGCASSRPLSIHPVNVHLVTGSMTEIQIQELARSARRQGGIVRLSAIDQGESIERPTIVIPFVLSDGSIIRELQNGFSNLGYERVDIQYQPLGKHSYTTNNIGVYLPSLTTNHRSTYIQDLAQTYASECPNFDAELTLFNHGEARFEIYDISESGVESISHSLKGRWESANERLRIELVTAEPLSFTVLRLRREDIGRLDLGIILQGQDNEGIFADCSFSSVGYILKS